ncbi:hypothetical protein [Silvibacterium acidisoli]|uniref:hypothetical protein n=1 Tax=Acidobacteriaceae bacterium ZG23-2 TaxID=2883246 RepID=UPI00406D3E26
MSSAPWKADDPAAGEGILDRNKGRIALTSFLLALLQSICSAVVAVNGLRLAIGLGAVVLSSGAMGTLVRFHVDWIRIPMIVLAVAGSVLNLAILAHVRYLRNRPSSQWRRQPLSAHAARMERLQIWLAVLTFVLVGIEESLHLHFHHHL